MHRNRGRLVTPPSLHLRKQTFHSPLGLLELNRNLVLEAAWAIPAANNSKWCLWCNSFNNSKKVFLHNKQMAATPLKEGQPLEGVQTTVVTPPLPQRLDLMVLLLTDKWSILWQRSTIFTLCNSITVSTITITECSLVTRKLTEALRNLAEFHRQWVALLIRRKRAISYQIRTSMDLRPVADYIIKAVIKRSLILVMLEARTSSSYTIIRPKLLRLHTIITSDRKETPWMMQRREDKLYLRSSKLHLKRNRDPSEVPTLLPQLTISWSMG